MLRAKKITIIGIVQGVGFRPYIYRLAHKTGLYGYVRNMGGSEVIIHIEGEERNIELFLNHLKSSLPPVAKIEKIIVNEVEREGYNRFMILPSLKKRFQRSIVPPDFSICRDCLQEVLDKNSRWYRYPFNSCAYCGPRYSMMEDIPYDRENTSMRDFPLCKRCKEEYNDPNNIRRFHAQGISCPECGPRIWLADKDGREIYVEDPIKEAAKLIDEGYIISIKGLGGFHIACLATDDTTIIELRRRKRRPEKPLAIMVRDTSIAEKLVYLDNDNIRLLEGPEHPILLLPEKDNSPLSRYIAPGLRDIGIFLPYTALHYMLLERVRDHFLIMTSGNPEGEPMCIKNSEAITKLRDIVDYHLLHNRRIINRVDDSVIRYTYGKPTFLRRGRGYAPYWITLDRMMENEVVAFGAMLQNTGAIGFDNKIVPTQFIGDCEDLRTLLDLKLYLIRLGKLYRLNLPNAIVAVDKHPGYPTMRIAIEWVEKHNSELYKIQHHWAHIASVLAENNIYGEYPGIAIDGAGYGEDGNIWGGEILSASLKDYKRIGHIEYYPMPGGDIATIYPARILTGILYGMLNENEIKRLYRKYNVYRGFKDDRELDIIIEKLKSRNPQTSSLGRVLDAVSVLLGIGYTRTYEGELAMKLEAYSEKGEINIDIPIKRENGIYKICIKEMFMKIIEYMDENKDRRRLAYEVQYRLGEKLTEIALTQRKDLITVSGGAAVNTIIIEAIHKKCREMGVKLLTNKYVPPGDGGISLGQVAIAGNIDY